MQVIRISSKTHEGIPHLWTTIKDFREAAVTSGEFDLKRRTQHKIWMWNHIRENILKVFKNHPHVKQNVVKYENMVTEGLITPGYAADELIDEFLNKISNPNEDNC